MSSKKRIYLEYIRSEHWLILRMQALQRDKFRCARCGNRRFLHVHHVHYKDDLATCTVDDLLTLCEKCHKKIHKKEFKERRRWRRWRWKKLGITGPKPRLRVAALILKYDASEA